MSVLYDPERLSFELKKAIQLEVQENLSMGIPVYYSTKEHPGRVVKLLPNGERFFVSLDDNHNEIISGKAN